MRHRLTVRLAAAALLWATLAAPAAHAAEPTGLEPATAFDRIADPRERSLALFVEAAKVITHPRCMNCHPASDRPLQGDDKRPHVPVVRGGPGGAGIPGLACNACHQDRNVTLAAATVPSMPGHPRWHLAPLEMAWEGRSTGQICTQLKDPARNGGRSLAALLDHMAHDDLVAWGWNPGEGRAPAPGTQAIFGDLIKAWIDTGAACP